MAQLLKPLVSLVDLVIGVINGLIVGAVHFLLGLIIRKKVVG